MERETIEYTEYRKAMQEMHRGILAAQRSLKNVGFDSDNPHFKNEYASLAAVRNAVLPAFHAHGIAVVQELGTRERGPVVTTRLLHENGYAMTAGELSMPAGKQDAQGWAGCITYARRYSLLALGGVTGDYDDDGESASAREEPEPPKPEKKAKATK